MFRNSNNDGEEQQPLLYSPTSSPLSNFSHRSSSIESSSLSSYREKELPTDCSPAAVQKVFLLFVYLFLSIIFCAGNQILFKKVLNLMSSPSVNYGFFISQFTTLLYITLACFVLAFRLVFSKKKQSLKQMLETPIILWVVMGALDGLGGFLSAVGGAHTSGQLQTLLTQTMIPITLITSYFYLKSRYSLIQSFGALVILIGVGVAMIPAFTQPSAGVKWMSAIIYFVSVIPQAWSNCYKEKHLKEDELDVYFVTVTVSIAQELIGFLFLPLLSIPALGGVHLDELPNQISDAFKCFLGEDQSSFGGPQCHNTYIIFLAYVAVNFMYNVLMLLITKHGSAVLLLISSALSLPVSNLCFTSTWLLGDDAEPFSWWDLGGLFLIVLGFVTYTYLGKSSEFVVTQGAPGQMTYVVAHNEEPKSKYKGLRRNSVPHEIICCGRNHRDDDTYAYGRSLP